MITAMVSSILLASIDPVLSLLHLQSIYIDAQTSASAVINTTSPQANLSLQAEKQKVQKDLTDLLRKAISLEVEIPEISGFDEHNATLYVKVNVNNTGERKANASDFSFLINYESKSGSSGAAGVYGSDAGVIVRLPESTYGLVPQISETGDPVKDSFINSFGRSSYTGDCYGEIGLGESKECTITKSMFVSSNNTSNSTNLSQQSQSGH